MRRAMESLAVLSVVVVLIAATYWLLKGAQWYGAGVLVMALLPLAVARLGAGGFRRLIPDLIFGAIDSGLLVVAACIGAAGFGLKGAIIGGVVGDAVTDGIAGFFEGGIAEWLRARGIEESRTTLGSSCGKMAGCLAGSGSVLCVLQLAGFDLARLAGMG